MILASTAERVRALQTYADHLAEVDHHEKLLADHEAALSISDRLTTTLARTGADQTAITHLTHLHADLHARIDARTDARALLDGDLSTLTTTRKASP